MKILYKQSSQLQKISLLEQLGISNCHFKQVDPLRDSGSITPRSHHHTSCEIHLVTKGFQHYQVAEELHTVKAGCFILIPPNTAHKHLFSEPGTEKYSITFGATPSPTNLAAHLMHTVLCVPLCRQAQEALTAIEAEARHRREFSSVVMECRIFELLLAIARYSGFREEPLPDVQDEDSRVSMARQYVLDNIERPITCPELANYCHLSQKQLTRLFQQYTDQTPAAYIRAQKVRRIEMLLTESNLSLRQISDRLHFASENHFNSFFTKYAGMTPGAYRKMNNRSAQ